MSATLIPRPILVPATFAQVLRCVVVAARTAAAEIHARAGGRVVEDISVQL